MTKENQSDFNVILLPSYESEMEEMIQTYIDILSTCITRSDIEALIRLVAHDSRVITLREICTKKIELLAEVLNETKIES